MQGSLGVRGRTGEEAGMGGAGEIAEGGSAEVGCTYDVMCCGMGCCLEWCFGWGGVGEG